MSSTSLRVLPLILLKFRPEIGERSYPLTKFRARKRKLSATISCSRSDNSSENSSTNQQQQQLNLSVLRFTFGIPGLDESYLPRWIGYAFGSLLLLNHFVGSDSSAIAPAQLRTEVLGLSLAAFSIVIPYLGKFLKGATPINGKSIPQGAEQIFLMSTNISDTLKEDLAWATYVLLRNTNTISVLILVQDAICSEPCEVLRIKENEVQGQTTLVGIPKRNMDFLSSISLKPEESCQFSEFSELWDAHKGLIPPVQENFLSNEKHCQRMKFLNIDENLGNLDAPGKGQSSQMCPIMLLKNIQDGFTPRWSIILPLSWVKAFWITVIFNGAQAIGLREKHWIACDAGLPYFPSDFPDSNAYSCFKAMETAIMDQKASLRPPVLRPLRVPILLPWDCVQCGSHERSITAGDTEVLPVSDNSMQNINCEKCGIPAVGGHGASFDGFVARTSYKLIHFLTHISGDHLLLFPNLPDGKRCLTKVMKDEEIINQQTNGISLQFTCCQKLCFVRVLLHAYKEGVFEEGAVVCAPHASDITMWTARSEDDDDGKIQVHQSLLGSYFVQQPSGRWELQVPEDPVVRESHRWPIGFVTTGFVRGSKKPRAIALCDAVLLARLREEQWKTISIHKRRKEIYVLVRNLRSTAYRLALATIVLEEREDDVEYM